jgi:uncharacterized caspase-like protein
MNTNRAALIIGIDDYHFAPLAGCVNDARKMAAILSRHEDGTPNFDCQVIVSSTSEHRPIERATLKEAVTTLCSLNSEVALFYFSGHGTANNLGGYLVTHDAKRYDEGMPLTDVLTLARKSVAREVIVILDCCHSGELGQLPQIDNDSAVLREGVSILTASRASQEAVEVGGGGLFTSIVADALTGGAVDVLGNVTVAAVYAYVDQALGVWEQRPLFKSHVSQFTPLRKCNPPIDVEILRLLPTYFPNAYYDFPLDPSFEPTAEPGHDEHEKIFGHLQRLRATRLVVPVGEEHMYYAAVNL